MCITLWRCVRVALRNSTQEGLAGSWGTHIHPSYTKATQGTVQDGYIHLNIPTSPAHNFLSPTSPPTLCYSPFLSLTLLYGFVFAHVTGVKCYLFFVLISISLLFWTALHWLPCLWGFLSCDLPACIFCPTFPCSSWFYFPCLTEVPWIFSIWVPSPFLKVQASLSLLCICELAPKCPLLNRNLSLYDDQIHPFFCCCSYRLCFWITHIHTRTHTHTPQGPIKMHFYIIFYWHSSLPFKLKSQSIRNLPL